jgi:uracil-DNA glycosylase
VDTRLELNQMAAQFLRQLEERGESFLLLEDVNLADYPGAESAGISVGEAPPAPSAAAGSEARPGESLEEFGARIASCTGCSLHESRTNFVFGAGDPGADMLFIGEGPGAEEDRQGLPFVGRSGQLLTKIIASIGFTREEIYIANMVKCRPPGNRDPRPDEISACNGHLLAQLDLIQPKVIVTLGRFSAGHFHDSPGAAMRDMRGQVGEFHGVKVVSTYHPAALLRNSNWKRGCWEDMLLARKVYDQAGGRTSKGAVYRPAN